MTVHSVLPFGVSGARQRLPHLRIWWLQDYCKFSTRCWNSVAGGPVSGLVSAHASSPLYEPSDLHSAVDVNIWDTGYPWVLL